MINNVTWGRREQAKYSYYHINILMWDFLSVENIIKYFNYKQTGKKASIFLRISLTPIHKCKVSGLKPTSFSLMSYKSGKKTECKMGIKKLSVLEFLN